MLAQGNLFGSPIDADPPEAEPTQPQEALPVPLAAPCAFRNRRNEPCRRLACRPILLEGQQLHTAGRPLIMCEPDCYNAAPEAGMEPRHISIEDTEWTAHGYD